MRRASSIRAHVPLVPAADPGLTVRQRACSAAVSSNGWFGPAADSVGYCARPEVLHRLLLFTRGVWLRFQQARIERVAALGAARFGLTTQVVPA